VRSSGSEATLGTALVNRIGLSQLSGNQAVLRHRRPPKRLRCERLDGIDIDQRPNGESALIKVNAWSFISDHSLYLYGPQGGCNENPLTYYHFGDRARRRRRSESQKSL
jgi:hypothetical protein